MDWKSLAAAAAPVVVTVTVELPYGRTMNIPLGTLTYGEWMQATTMAPEPAVPRTLVGPGNVKQLNPADVTYRAAVAEANEKRSYLRLAMALEKGGMVIPGAALDDKAQTIRDELDAGVANALMEFLASAAMNGKAQAEATADGFRG